MTTLSHAQALSDKMTSIRGQLAALDEQMVAASTRKQVEKVAIRMARLNEQLRSLNAQRVSCLTA